MNAAKNLPPPAAGSMGAAMRSRYRRADADPDEPPAGPPAVPSAPIGAAALPEPYQAADTDTLNDREQADLVACEAAIDTLRMAFWAAGKALQVIRDGRLYRATTHTTFEEYVEGRWQMSRPQAYRLIEAWPLAQALSPMGDTLNERQVRELLPLAERHGQEAAETVYRAVTEVDGVRVTAAVLKGVVSALPNDRFDPVEAVEQIRAYLAGAANGQNAPRSVETTAAETFTVEAGRLRTILQRIAKRDIARSAATENPEEVKKVVTELRALLDEIEQTGNDR